MVRRMSEVSPCTNVDIFADRGSHGFTDDGLIDFKNYNLHHFEYYGIEGDEIVRANSSLLKNMADSKVVLSDWVRGAHSLVDKVRHSSRVGDDTYLVGLYHANLEDAVDDDDKMRRFRQKQRGIVDNLDLYLHTTADPDPVYRTSTPVIPVPLVVRESEENPRDVKRLLGMRNSERFIYVVVGGKGNGSMNKKHDGRKNYEVFFDSLDSIDAASLGVDKIVVNTGGKDVSFSNPDIITVDKVPNGQDYVRAAEMVVGKPGMGTLAECLKFGTPFLMAKWKLEAEEMEKVRLLKEVTGEHHPTIWGHSPEHISDRIRLTMARRYELADSMTRVPTNGASVVAEIVDQLQDRTGALDDRVHAALMKLTPYQPSGGRFGSDIRLKGDDYHTARRLGAVELAGEGLNPGDMTLEVGCNSGIITKALAQAGINAVGIDISPKSVSRARNGKPSRAEFYQMGAEDLRFRDNNFDTVILTEVLEHVADPEKVLEEALRVTHWGGRLVIGVPRDTKIYEPSHRHFYTPESLASLLSKYSDCVEFRNIPGVDRHMHVVVTKTRDGHDYERRPSLYGVSLSDIRQMKKSELRALAEGLPSVDERVFKMRLRRELMDYKLSTIAYKGRPIHRGTKVVDPKTMDADDVRALNRYDQIYGLACRIDLRRRERYNKHQLKELLVKEFERT
ncbi:methyltransferase domain-containing protein [Candidatus Woesearchaeota archaeon]|nr:methyltransferase domain-containing protein [Candidatus Woesearchaeota archaeon]